MADHAGHRDAVLAGDEEGRRNAVLVVDDEPQLRHLMVRLLERGGHRLLSAADAESGLALYAEHADAVGAVVLDMALPPDGAGELLRRMEELGRDVGVVVTSGRPLEESLRESLERCGGRFVAKPFAPPALLAAVADVLDRGA